MEKSDHSASLAANQISFGKSLIINTEKRLPQFDNGDVLAYEGHIARNKSKKFIVLVSGVDNLPRWTSVATYKNMNDVSFMHLAHSGAVFWPPARKQMFILAYDRDVGVPLVVEGTFSTTSWRHPDIVTLFIEPMARMLKEMGDKGFVHGSIRPSNIYCFPNETNKPVVLGDTLSVQAHSTQPPVFLPINKALADPLGRGRGVPADDIYAFGISLFFFLRKNDEFSGVDDEDIVRRKIEFGSYSTIIGKERLQASFTELLRGLLYDDETLRWGVDDILSWLDGVRATPLTLAKRKKANRPFVFNGKKYLYAELLALDLHHNPEELAVLFKKGSLDRWVNKAIDSTYLVERYEKALERIVGFSDISENRDYFVLQIGLALNPELPVHYGGMCFTYDGVGALMAHAVYEERNIGVFKKIMDMNILDNVLVGANMNQAMMLAVLKQYDACRGFLTGKRLEQGIERCLYILCPDTPCLSPKVRGYFVYHPSSTLLAFEALCKQGGQVSLMMDKHLLAFFAARDARFMSSYLHDFNSTSKDEKISGNLHFMATLQKQSKIKALPAIADVFVGSLSGVYKAYKNVGTRKRVQDEVLAAAKIGDLTRMSHLIDDTDALEKDANGFKIAVGEHKLLQQEYDQYNKKLAYKKTYGVMNGHETAAIVSMLVSTIIIVFVVLSFLAGNQIF